jgi:hypothetical protein
MLNQAWEPAIDAVVEPHNFVGGMILHFTQVNECLNDGTVSPDIGSAQIVHAQDLYVFEGHNSAGVGLGNCAGDGGVCQSSGDTIICKRAGVQQILAPAFYFYRRPSMFND